MIKRNLKLLVIVQSLLFLTLLFPKATLASSISTPTDLSAEVESSSEIYLDWDSVSAATSYYVYRANSSSGTYTRIATTTSSNYTDSDLDSDTTYYYKVQAVNSSSVSSYSSLEHATTDEDEDDSLSTPTGLSAEAESSTEIYLDWDSVSDATSYYVYRATSSTGSYSKIATTTSSNYTDSDLDSDTTYYYKVMAHNSSDTSPLSAKDHATTLDEDEDDSLSAPSDFSAEVENSDEIYLDWDSVSDATSYYVYRSTSSSGSYSRIATTTSSSYTDTDLDSDTTYYYKLQAVNSDDKSSYSSVEHATTDEEDDDSLSAPTDLSVQAESSGDVYLDWDSVSDADSYYVYRSTLSSGTYTRIGITSSSSYTDTDVDTNATYYYKVQAVNSNDTSSYSSVKYVTISDQNDSLSAPTDLIAVTQSSSEVYLDWDSINDAVSYYIYRASSSSGTYSKISTSTNSSYTDSNLDSNTTYYYKVQAVNDYDTSSFSSIAYATTSQTSGTVPTGPSSQIQPVRLQGNDMYGTSSEIANKWISSYYAVIVNGGDFSDALCSAPLAQKYNAPILLATQDGLDEQAKTQLTRLKVKSVFIIGGTGIISSDVEQDIKNMGIDVTRIAGSDSYETSVKIAQAMGQFNQAVVASGQTFPDALSIAPIAAMKGIPILLTSKDSLPASVKDYLLKTVQSTYVVGGTGVISDSVFGQLPSPKRLSGLTRYETNISIINEFANELDFSTCYISTGENYADALCGSALASLSNSPVVLVSEPAEQCTLDFFKNKISSIQNEIVFGGTAVVPDSVLSTLNNVTPESSDIPSSPSNITATAESSSQITLKWESVSGATSYYVYGATSPSGTYSRIASVTTPNFINTGLWADTTYYYKVQAVNSSGSSTLSAIASAKTSLSY